MDNSRYIEQDEQLRDELIKRIREAGINVVTDWKEGERILQQANRNVSSRKNEEENLKKWFGNSKITDVTGKPQVFYHGTNSDFDTFEMSKSAGMAMFTSDKELAEKFAARWPTLDKNGKIITDEKGEYKKEGYVMPVYLKVENPKVIDMEGYDWTGRGVGTKTGKSINKGRKGNFAYLEAKNAKRQGFDGLILKNVTDSGVMSNHIIVFNASQIKSARNIGTFREDRLNIYEQRTGGYTPQEIEQKIGPRLTANNYQDIRKINPFVSFLWSDKIPEHMDYREVVKTPTMEDYYFATKAKFKSVGASLDLSLDFESIMYNLPSEPWVRELSEKDSLSHEEIDRVINDFILKYWTYNNQEDITSKDVASVLSVANPQKLMDMLLACEMENQRIFDEMKKSGKYEHQKSPKSDSEYLLDHKTGDIFRLSNHWGRVASCIWHIDNNAAPEGTSIYEIGKCNIRDFKPNYFQGQTDNPEYPAHYADALQRTIHNYETLLHSKVEITDAARQRIENTLENYRKLQSLFEENGYRESKYTAKFMLAPDTKAPIFVSNAMMALQNIRQEKATPLQWLKMLEKNGGIKAGEDRWTGLSEWLRNSEEKSLSRKEVMEYVSQNNIKVEEVNYVEGMGQQAEDRLAMLNEEFSVLIDEGEVATNSYYTSDWVLWAYNQMLERYGDDFQNAFEIGEGVGTNSRLTPATDFDGELTGQAKDFLGIENDNEKAINGVRLEYTSEGLVNKREIALTVPDIESWNIDDDIHFGDAGEGRAIAWVRFGETINKTHFSIEEQKKLIEQWPPASAWVKVDGSNTAQGNDLYYISDVKNKYGLDYIANVNGRYVIELSASTLRTTVNPFPSSGYDSLQEAVNEYYKWSVKKSYKEEKILVIDEIQSKRHQEGREKGYAVSEEEAAREMDAFLSRMKEKYHYGPHTPFKEIFNASELQELQRLNRQQYNATLNHAAVPDAPFEKNWQELALKRMLRYAAENGYNRVAWLNGIQQAERYSLGGKVDSIFIDHSRHHEGRYSVTLYDSNASVINAGSPDNATEESLRELFGKGIADQLLKGVADLDKKKEAGEVPKSTAFVLEGQSLEVGGEGMRAFYDRMLPNFMNKYCKKWNVQVEPLDVPSIAQRGTSDGKALHSVRVTKQMMKDVLQGQPMFFRDGAKQVYGFTVGGSIYIDPRIATAETPIHEYAHLWAEVLRQRNPQEWENIVQMMKDTPELWNQVRSEYPHLVTDSQIADEVLARYSGQRGYERLMAFTEGKENGQELLEKIKMILGRFWQEVANFLQIHYTSKEQVADQIMKDLLSKVNPLDQTKSLNFKRWFGNWEKPIIYSAYKVDDTKGLEEKYPSALPNKFYHHSTVSYGHQSFDDREGQKKTLHITGRLTTDKVDVLVVENPESNNKIPHITLATAEGVQPAVAKKELETHKGGIIPLDDYVDTTFRNIPDRYVSKIVDEKGLPLVVEHGTHAKFTEFDISHLGETGGDKGMYGAGFYFATHAPAWIGDKEPMKVFLDIKQPFELSGDIKSDIYTYLKETFDIPALRMMELHENGKSISLGEYIDHIKNVDADIAANKHLEAMEKDEELMCYHPKDRVGVWREHQIAGLTGFIMPGSISYMIQEMIGSEKFTETLKQAGYDGVIIDRGNDYREFVAFQPNQIKSATDNIGTFLQEDNDIRFQYDIKGLEDYKEDEIKKMVREYMEEKLEYSDIDVEIVDMKVIGSRVNGNSDKDSDLDVLLEFKGDASEDSLFNILNDEEDGRLYIEGIPVDINPITEGKSGTIEEFLERNKDYIKTDKPNKTTVDMENSEKNKISGSLQQLKDMLTKTGKKWGEDISLQPTKVSVNGKDCTVSRIAFTFSDNKPVLMAGSYLGNAAHQYQKSIEEFQKFNNEMRAKYGGHVPAQWPWSKEEGQKFAELRDQNSRFYDDLRKLKSEIRYNPHTAIVTVENGHLNYDIDKVLTDGESIQRLKNAVAMAEMMKTLQEARTDIGEHVEIKPTTIKLAGMDVSISGISFTPFTNEPILVTTKDLAVIGVEEKGEVQYALDKILTDNNDISRLTEAVRERLQLVADYEKANLLYTPLFLVNPVEHSYQDAEGNNVKEQLNAYAVDNGLIMLYNGMDAANRNYNPTPASILPEKEQLQVYDEIMKNIGYKEPLRDLDGTIRHILQDKTTYSFDNPVLINEDRGIARDYVTGISIKEKDDILLNCMRIDEAGARATYDLTKDEYSKDDLNKVVNALEGIYQKEGVQVSGDGEQVSVKRYGELEEIPYRHVHGWTHDDPALLYGNTETEVFFYDKKENTVENIENPAGIDAYENREGFFLVRADQYEEAYLQLQAHDAIEQVYSLLDKLPHTVNVNEASLISQYVMDQASGNHLLRDKQPEGYEEIVKEISKAHENVMDMHPLTERQRGMLVTESLMYHGGVSELAEELNVDKNYLSALLKVPVANDRKEEIMNAREEINTMITETGLDYLPLSLGKEVSDQGVTYPHAMVTNDDVLVFQNRGDACDNYRPVYLSEMQEDKQLEVLQAIRENYSDPDKQVIVQINTEQVPTYALPAIVNGDFSGLDEVDEKNIKAFMEHEKKMGAQLFVLRDEDPSFNTHPAFGKATDTVKMDMIRTATIRELREEYKTQNKMQGEGATKKEMEDFTKSLARVREVLDSYSEGKVITHELKGLLSETNRMKPSHIREHFQNLFATINKNGNSELYDEWRKLSRLSGGNLWKMAWAIAYKLSDEQIKNISSEMKDEKKQEEKPYRIAIGEDNRPGGVKGEYHVEFTKDINYVSFDEMQSVASSMGGSARVTDKREWADFYSQADAEKFAEKVVALNAERIVGTRQETRQELDDRIWKKLDSLLPENADKILLEKPFVITEAKDLSKGMKLEAKMITRSISPDYEKDVFVAVDDYSRGINTFRMNNLDLYRLEGIINDKKFSLDVNHGKVMAPQQDNSLQGISKAVVHKGKGNTLFVRAEVNGKNQPSKEIKPGDVKDYRQGNVSAMALAQKYFKRELENKQNNGMKR